MNSIPPNSAASGSGPQRPPPVIPDHELLRVIGQGSYGEVWLARNIMGTYRAVKVVRRASFDSARPYEREFEGIKRFEPVSHRHPSQLPIFHVGRNDAEGYFFYVMELADAAEPLRANEDGGLRMEDRPAQPSSILDPLTYTPRTLEHELKRLGRLPFAECLRISLALANALKHLHAHGLVHRDIKPANIVFVNGLPKLADIGLVADSEAALAGFGTDGFTSPQGAGHPEGDIFSLGRVIYEICTGCDRKQFPALPRGFGSWPERDQMRELLAIANHACEPDSARRYASADALLADLELLQARGSVRQLRRLQTLKRWAALVVGVFAVLAVAGWWYAAQTRAWQTAIRRELRIRQAQQDRAPVRSSGWSKTGLGKLQEAGRIKLDDDLRAQAAAALAGLDAQNIGRNLDSGADYLAFNATGKRLLMNGGATNGPARMWQLGLPEPRELGVKGSGPVWFEADGSPRLLTFGGAGTFSLWNPATTNRLTEFSVGQTLTSLAPNAQSLVVSEDTSRFVAALNNAAGETTVVLCDPRTGQMLARTNLAATAVAISPDNSLLAAGQDDGLITVWTLPDLRPVTRYSDDRSRILCLAFGRSAGSVGDRGAGRAWLLAAGDAGGSVRVHEAATSVLVANCRGHFHKVFALAFSPDGMALAGSGHGLSPAMVWDVATGERLLGLNVSTYTTALAFSADGTKLACGTAPGAVPNGAVQVFGLSAGRGIRALTGLRSTPQTLAFSDDSQRLAVLADNWEVGVWNLTSNRLDWRFQAPKGLFADNAALRFSKDGRSLVFATFGAACRWNLDTGQEMAPRWQLPPGLGQLLWFDTESRLFLFQFDRVPGKGDHGWTRELMPGGEVRKVRQLFLFDRLCRYVNLSQSGKALAVAGCDSSSSNQLLKVLDPLTGKEILPLECRRPASIQYNHLPLDATGQHLSLLAGPQDESTVLDLRDSSKAQRVRLLVQAISPQGIWLAGPALDRAGIKLLKRADPAWSLILGADWQVTGALGFSPDGRLLAWGTVDGTVLVCDIAETLDRLNAEGFGRKRP